MGDTDIDWADKVWNPVTGCTNISEGCRNCYAERMHRRLEKIKGSGYDDGNKHFSIRQQIKRLEEPLKWKKPQRIFVCSMGDLFHEDVSCTMLRDVFHIMDIAREHTFILLTKRPQRMKWFINFDRIDMVKDYPHVWLGVTVENQKAADERIPLLLQIPAAKRFISIEPMVGPVDLPRAWWGKEGDPSYPWLGENANEWLHWVILGGETGPKARSIHHDWVRSVRDQCQAVGVPFFFKQWGEWLPLWSADEADNYPKSKMIEGDDGERFVRVGKKAAGHLLDGKEYRELPE